MARTKISEFSATPGDNTDIDGIDIAEGCAPSGINNAIRELMAQLKDMQTGASGDTFTLTTVNSTTVDTTNLEATNLKAKDGTAAGSIADSTGVVTLGSSVLTTTDINGGTVDGTTIGASVPSTVVATQVDITAQGDLRLQDTTGGQYVALQAPGTVATSYTLTLPVDDGTAGQALITDGSGVLSWSSAASGDVYGPGSATDNAVARYDGTTGKIIQNSAVTIGDDGATVIAANSSSDGLRITQTGAGNALLVEDSANPDATPFVVTADGRVGVNVASSSIFGDSGIQMQSESSTGAVGFYLRRAENSGGSASVISFDKLRGTFAVPTAAQNADTLGYLFFRGYDGAGNITAASITSSVDGTPGTNDMPGRLVFSTTADGASSPTERMRIRSDGNIGIGSSGSATSKVFIGGTYATSGGFSSGFETAAVIPSGTTTLHANFDSKVYTQAASFTLGTLNHFSATQPSAFGAGSTVTSQVGFNAASNLTGATNNYGFFGNIASGTGRWNFYAAGTADNYFAGNVGIGITAPVVPLDVYAASGTAAIRAQGDGVGAQIQISRFSNDASAPLALLRKSRGTVASPLAIATSDTLGTINFQGFCGTNTRQLVAISGTVEQYVSDTNVSANLILSTVNAGTTLVERMRIGSTGTISLGAAPGAESLRVTPVASAVNYVEIRGQAISGAPQIYAKGSDTNIFLEYYSKGTGNHLFYTNGEFPSRLQQFAIAHTASAVNYLQVTGGATGGNPVIAAAGTDTNISLSLTPKGTGGLLTISTGQTVAGITTTTLGGSVSVFDSGTSAGNGGSVMFGAASGAWRFAAIKSNVTSGSNNTQGDLYFLTRRVSTDANLTAAAHITGAGVTCLGSIQGSESVRVSPVASAVNLWDFVGSATGGFIGAYANGSDTNIDMKLIPKGTGVLSFGTYTAGVVTQAGYITIKDAAGNTRRLLVG